MKKYFAMMILALIDFSYQSKSEPTKREQPNDQEDSHKPFELGF